MQEIVNKKKKARTMSKRIEALEAEIAEMKRLQNLLLASRPESSSSGHGLQSMVGLFADDPGFDEVVRLGREWRQRQK